MNGQTNVLTSLVNQTYKNFEIIQRYETIEIRKLQRQLYIKLITKRYKEGTYIYKIPNMYGRQ